MRRVMRRRSRVGLAGALAALGLLVVVTSGFAGATATGKSSERELTDAEDGTFEVLEAADQYAEARTSPAEVVEPGAFSGAYAEAKALPVFGGPWTELTTQNYNSDAQGYRDPVWSNSGGGAGLVSGRVTALDGGPWVPAGGQCLASNGLIHDAMLDVVARVRRP